MARKHFLKKHPFRFGIAVLVCSLSVILMISGCSEVKKMLSGSPTATIMPAVKQPATPLSSEEEIILPENESTSESSPTVDDSDETSVPNRSNAENRTLTLWVPPQFDPSSNDEAGKILTEMLKIFMEENPNTLINIRVKSLTGEGSAINTLSAAVNAAPEVVPSLIIMNRNDLVSAVQKGLIYPISTGLFTDPASWYPFAKESSTVNNLIYGIPIAGDPLVLGYRPSKTGSEINTWDEILSRGLPIAFEPSNPYDLFGTFIYLAKGGKITNDMGQPWLDQAKLIDTLNFFLSGGQKGAFPPSLAQGTSGSNANENWQLFLEGSLHIIVTKLTTFRHSQNADIDAIPLPLFNGSTSYPLVNTWNVVLSNSNPEIQNLAVKLAEKFADPRFNDQWTQSAGYLPVRAIGQTLWQNDSFYEKMVTICENGELIQTDQILNKITPVINEAVSSVIKTGVTPEDAAEKAIDAIK